MDKQLSWLPLVSHSKELRRRMEIGLRAKQQQKSTPKRRHHYHYSMRHFSFLEWRWRVTGRHIWQDSTPATAQKPHSDHKSQGKGHHWHLPGQVVWRTGSEERVFCPHHKGVLVAAGMKKNKTKNKTTTTAYQHERRNAFRRLKASLGELRWLMEWLRSSGNLLPYLLRQCQGGIDLLHCSLGVY